jgi:hypothetical protein
VDILVSESLSLETGQNFIVASRPCWDIRRYSLGGIPQGSEPNCRPLPVESIVSRPSIWNCDMGYH